MKKIISILVIILLMSASVIAQEIDYCEGDFDCDGDCDGTDASVFKLDFGRSDFQNPCPSSTPLPLLKTGQTLCFNIVGAQIDCTNTGQDGEHQKGFNRFTDNEDGTVTDNFTDLVWLKDASCFGQTTWVNALSECNILENGACGLRDGSNASDWRLPNVRELQSLLDYGQSNPTLPKGHPFDNVGSDYWSSTSYTEIPVSSWLLQIANGGLVNYVHKNTESYVWAVRNQASIQVPTFKTGQTTCYESSGSPINCTDTGQDGDLQKGTEWPNPRFTDNEDGTIKDNLTGLIWLKNANCFGTGPWDLALSDCNGLADGSCGLTDASTAGDWRLPNARELESLLHYGFDNPPLPNTEGTAKWLEGDPFNHPSFLIIHKEC